MLAVVLSICKLRSGVVCMSHRPGHPITHFLNRHHHIFDHMLNEQAAVCQSIPQKEVLRVSATTSAHLLQDAFVFPIHKAWYKHAAHLAILIRRQTPPQSPLLSPPRQRARTTAIAAALAPIKPPLADMTVVPAAAAAVVAQAVAAVKGCRLGPLHPRTSMRWRRL